MSMKSSSRLVPSHTACWGLHPKYVTTAHTRDFWVCFFRTLIQNFPDCTPIIHTWTNCADLHRLAQVATKNSFKNCTTWLKVFYQTYTLRENSIYCCCRCVSETVIQVFRNDGTDFHNSDSAYTVCSVLLRVSQCWLLLWLSGAASVSRSIHSLHKHRGDLKETY